MGVKKANEWAESYFLSYSLDASTVETFMNFLKLTLIRKELLVGGGGRFAKWFGNEDLIDFFKGV